LSVNEPRKKPAYPVRHLLLLLVAILVGLDYLAVTVHEQPDAPEFFCGAEILRSLAVPFVSQPLLQTIEQQCAGVLSRETAFVISRMMKFSILLLFAMLYGAAEAYEKGLADQLVPHDELLDRALALAGEIGSNPAPQLRMIKQLLTRNGSATDLLEVQRAESALLRECWKSPEHHAAVRSFLDKARAKRA